MEEMKGKVVLVTGASSGLGHATAQLLTTLGHRVYGTSRKSDAVTDAAWPMLALDVCSDLSVRACLAEILEREGRIDVLVNNAGHAFVGAIEETDIDEAKAQFETNFFGALRMMLGVLPFMRAQGAGHIVNISSLAGVVPFPFLGVYGASKHALEAISESLEYELGDTRIRVTLMEPDGMQTSIGFHHPRAEHAILTAKRLRLLRQLEINTREHGIEPSALAQEVASVIESDTPPLRVVIGDMAKEVIGARHTMPETGFRQMLAGRIRQITDGTAGMDSDRIS
ncbi:SDR family oxidoreductase [Caballeronia sp. dw_19]|uniref:SDR family oxidoreductase n=1 Tax=Caballeronia sp. dw_19 TaxID=2719791 RepID=UPI001BD220D2|nr:SDR family oxidoreductase [Caballeronia sp. dw_19]